MRKIIESMPELAPAMEPVSLPYLQFNFNRKTPKNIFLSYNPITYLLNIPA